MRPRGAGTVHVLVPKIQYTIPRSQQTWRKYKAGCVTHRRAAWFFLSCEYSTLFSTILGEIQRKETSLEHQLVFSNQPLLDRELVSYQLELNGKLRISYDSSNHGPDRYV